MPTLEQTRALYSDEAIEDKASANELREAWARAHAKMEGTALPGEEAIHWYTLAGTRCPLLVVGEATTAFDGFVASKNKCPACLARCRETYPDEV